VRTASPTMADGQRIQFGDDIHSVKQSESSPYATALDKSKMSQKVTGFDIEEKAVEIANADLNHKKKQVRPELSPITSELTSCVFRLTRDGFCYG